MGPVRIRTYRNGQINDFRPSLGSCMRPTMASRKQFARSGFGCLIVRYYGTAVAVNVPVQGLAAVPQGGNEKLMLPLMLWLPAATVPLIDKVTGILPKPGPVLLE